MADSILDILRKDAIQQRIKGVPGGNRIVWSAKDTSEICDHGMSMPEQVIRAAPSAQRKLPDVDRAALLRSVAEAGITVRDIQPADRNFLYRVSAEPVDLVNDSLKPKGIDCGDFNRNPAVLPGHDSSAVPIAISSPPWVSGNSLMAIAKFPQPGISAQSDQVAAAIRAGLSRGASIGFVPLKWSFSKDPARPMGIDFFEVKLLEWSCVSLPCQPDSLLVGAVSGEKSASASSSTPSTREQRMVEAAKIRQAAYRR